MLNIKSVLTNFPPSQCTLDVSKKIRTGNLEQKKKRNMIPFIASCVSIRDHCVAIVFFSRHHGFIIPGIIFVQTVCNYFLRIFFLLSCLPHCSSHYLPTNTYIFVSASVLAVTVENIQHAFQKLNLNLRVYWCGRFCRNY